jgi:hypothetical protein
MIEEDQVAVILAAVDFGTVNVSRTFMVIRIVVMIIVMALVIVEDLEEIGIAMETGIGFPVDVVAIEIGILVAEVVLVHVRHMELDLILKEKVAVDLEAEMMDLLQKEVLFISHFVPTARIVIFSLLERNST